jgi:hypothetical protein
MYSEKQGVRCLTTIRITFESQLVLGVFMLEQLLLFGAEV